MDEESEDSGSENEDELRELLELPEYRGIAVIIGNTYKQKDVQPAKGCKRLLPLNGPIKDTEVMKEAFDYLRFLTIVKHDLPHDKTKGLLELLAQHRYPKSCKRFVFTFSGHGGDGFICCEDGKTMNINEIIAKFSPTSDNNSLAGVPRLFFFDACRGELIDQGVVARGGEGEWRSKIPSTGDVLVAYATTVGYKAYEQFGGGLWTSILAKKLVTSLNSIYDILTEVNVELIENIKTMLGPSFQQPELLGRLNDIISLLKESGKQPKQMEQEAPVLRFLVNPSISARLSPGNDLSKNSKNKLQELCQSMKVPLPKYENQISENGFVVVTVSITIKGREICSTYTSEQALSTKKHIKQCEEIAAEKALTELNRTCAPIMSPQHTKSSDEQSSKPVQASARMSELQKAPSCQGYATGSPDKKAKSQLNELFQKYKINGKYDSTDGVTDGNVHNFTATFTYTVHGRKYRYESRGVFGRKQDAEEDTAQQALCEIEQQLKHPGGVSYKQLLKEKYCDEQQLSTPQYTTESTSGRFVSTVNVPQYKPVRGPVGNSKKEAEQLAAMEALRQLKI